MELESASRWEALQDPTIAGYVGDKVFKHRLMEKIDGTGGMALVVFRDGGWSSPDPIKTVEFPLLKIRCYADHSRNPDGTYMMADAPDKAWALWRAVEKRFHAVRDQWWGARGTVPGLRIVTCSLGSFPVLEDSTTLHTNAESRSMGDTVYVEGEFNVETAH